MELWLKQALDSQYIKEVTPESLQHGVQCAAMENAWYDSGVVFDWSQLHSRLTGSPGPSPAPSSASRRGGLSLDAEADGLFSFGQQLLSQGGEFLMVTVIEVRQPWELQPLSEQAQSWSVFSVSDTQPASAPATAGGLAPQRLYTFLRGPPGQRSAREDITSVLQSVTRQLREGKVHVQSFLSSFVLASNDFTTLLHQTAAVHKALKQAGLEMNTAASSYGPRRVFPLNDRWCTLPLESLTNEEDVALFTTDLFFQWLQDSYNWRCLGPIKVFADAPSSEKEGQEQLATKRLRLFETFLRRVLLPRVMEIGFQGLKACLPEEGGDLLELSPAHLKCKRVLTGPQKWTILDLRLTLCHVRAYELDPLLFFSEKS